ncbi:MAG TPA: DUF4168 domain-containing protein [Burkholderiaceae bacterium]|nr:DUF4168 domain-containing protein [Burkholderiaceae bacterium]
MQKRVLSVLSSAVIALGMSLGPAAAQQDSAQTQPPVDSAPAASYSDQQLEQFISASQKVAVISQEYTPKIEATSSQEEREEIFREADEKMVDAVEDEGLSVGEFNGINQALQEDPELEKRVTQMLD